MADLPPANADQTSKVETSKKGFWEQSYYVTGTFAAIAAILAFVVPLLPKLSDFPAVRYLFLLIIPMACYHAAMQIRRHNQALKVWRNINEWHSKALLIRPLDLPFSLLNSVFFLFAAFTNYTIFLGDKEGFHLMYAIGGFIVGILYGLVAVMASIELEREKMAFAMMLMTTAQCTDALVYVANAIDSNDPEKITKAKEHLAVCSGILANSRFNLLPHAYRWPPGT